MRLRTKRNDGLPSGSVRPATHGPQRTVPQGTGTEADSFVDADRSTNGWFAQGQLANIFEIDHRLVTLNEVTDQLARFEDGPRWLYRRTGPGAKP